MENLKIFKVRGEYLMSEEDNFKIAKFMAYNSAFSILDNEVENFLIDNYKNLDDEDIVEIYKKFLEQDETRYVYEDLPENEMICYAYIDAQINLDDLNDFTKNLDIYKLKNQVSEMQEIISVLINKLELYQKYLPDVINAEINVKNNSNKAWTYLQRGLAYYNLQNYSRAIEDYTQAINLNQNFGKAYKFRGIIYELLGETEKAEKDFEKARELGWLD